MKATLLLLAVTAAALAVPLRWVELEKASAIVDPEKTAPGLGEFKLTFCSE